MQAYSENFNILIYHKLPVKCKVATMFSSSYLVVALTI